MSSDGVDNSFFACDLEEINARLMNASVAVADVMRARPSPERSFDTSSYLLDHHLSGSLACSDLHVYMSNISGRGAGCTLGK